jgi:hypothetical protein
MSKADEHRPESSGRSGCRISNQQRSAVIRHLLSVGPRLRITYGQRAAIARGLPTTRREQR